MKSKTLWIVLASLAVFVVAGWTLVAAAAYAVGGVLTVEVEDRREGVDIYVPVPMALVDLAVSRVALPAVSTAGFGGVAVNDLDLGLNLGLGADVDLSELSPVLLDLVEEFDDLPDMTLVEVIDRDDYVRVSKHGDKLIVEVEEPETSVEVSIPMRGVLRLAERVLG